MTIISIKDWLAAKPEDRKELIAQGKTLSKLVYKEEIVEQAIASLEEALETIEYELCNDKTFEEMERTFHWAARSANDIYRVDGYDLVVSTHPHLAPLLPVYYQIYLEEIQTKEGITCIKGN